MRQGRQALHRCSYLGPIDPEPDMRTEDFEAHASQVPDLQAVSQPLRKCQVSHPKSYQPREHPDERFTNLVLRLGVQSWGLTKPY